MNFLEKEIAPGLNITSGSLIHFSRYAGEGTRKTTAWCGIITRVKARKIQVFLPVLNAYEWVRNNQLIGFEAGIDDNLTDTKAASKLRYAAVRIKRLAKKYTNGTEEL
jgi:hypothetical protein